MRTWKEVIAEATAAEIHKAGAAALRDERNKAKAAKQEKGKSAYQDYLERQLAFKKEKYEAQKKAQIERLQKGKVQGHVEKAKASLAGIKTQSISDKDKDPTAYAKAIGNVGSAAAGVAGAVVHGVRALAAKRAAAKEAEAAKEKQPEKRERQEAGRPPTPPKPASSSGARKPAPYSQQYGVAKSKTTKQITGTPERPKLPSAGGRSLPPAGPRRLPPSGGTTPTQSLGQQARQNPELKKRMISQRNQTEEYSNWREEFLYEVDDKFDKEQKKKIVDVMKGKNRIEINPLEKSVKEAVDQSDTIQNQDQQNQAKRQQKQQSAQQIQQQQVQTRNQMMLQQKQQALQQKLQQIAKQKVSLEKQGKLAVPSYSESYDEGDETFRQHSRETFANHKPSETRARTSRVLQKMKELNKDAKAKKKKMKEEYIEEKSPTWQTNAGKDLKKGGLNKKGIASYRREHPGSHLSMAVTTPPSKLDPDSKSAKRRKSFCARMSGMPGPMKDEKGRPTRKALSLRKWNC